MYQDEARHIRWLAMVLVLGACSRSNPADRSAPASPPAVTPTTPSPPARALPTVDVIDCAKVLPASLVDRYFPGAKVTSDVAGICDVSQGDLDFNIEYKCQLALSDADATSALEMLHGKPVPGLGRAAAETAMQLEVFDDDSACLLVASFAQPVPRLIDFLKDALASVPAR